MSQYLGILERAIRDLQEQEAQERRILGEMSDRELLAHVRAWIRDGNNAQSETVK